MPVHEFICDNCGYICVDCDTKKVHICIDCGHEMRWNLHGVGIASGDYHHVSESLAISPEQAMEHREMFPDVNVLDDGRLEFNSYKAHDRYLTKTGFVKKEQKRRKRITAKI